MIFSSIYKHLSAIVFTLQYKLFNAEVILQYLPDLIRKSQHKVSESIGEYQQGNTHFSS